MKTTIWALIVLSTFLIGCSVQHQTAYSHRKKGFHTPPDWRKPITKNSSSGESKSFEPVFDKSGKQFEPVFDKAGKRNVQAPSQNEQMIGYASWYGPGFHGKSTANGERYNQKMMTAAHKILPMNTWVQVTNLENNRTAVVRINDRGPYKKNRIVDLTERAAQKLEFKEKGTARVSLKVLQYPKDYDPSKGLKPYKQVVVQIAVFKAQKRADNFKNQLSRKYHKIQFMIDKYKGAAYHVVAGPYNERSRATSIARALKSDGIDNFVRSYRK
ncbi:MAG: septal ring lytic transglycosylase RlpA family protein [Proteobacteria bacterium]|nr:septal ring lytic transglycosylase RlpA family protein [Pseudomonadota bacterium]